MSTPEVFFLGNCQASRMAQFYGMSQSGSQKRSMLFRSITPHFGEYHEDEAIRCLEAADIAVVQLVTSDVTFNRDAVREMRGGKPVIFVPYVYLPGFRRLEKLSSKGRPRIDGEDVLRAEMDRTGHGPRAAIAFMRGQVSGQNVARFQAALDEMRRREGLGADVRIADYIEATYREWMPCFAVNHPTPHVLFEMYNQVARLAGFTQISVERLTPYDIGRATLPAGNGGLTPYCVEELGLSYSAETHWFSSTNRLAQEIARRWQSEQKESA